MLIIISSSFIINIVYNISVYLFIKEYIIFANDESLYKNINSSLNGKVSNFSSGNYKAVTGLAYDATNKKLGLKVGADTVIPFKSGGEIILLGSYDGYYTATVNCTSIPNYQDLTIDNFYIKVTSLNSTMSTAGISSSGSMSYDKSSGTLTISPMYFFPSSSNTENSWGVTISYKLYCYYC